MKISICKVFENGDKHWFLHGRLHREDGSTNGNKRWYLNGGKLTKENFQENIQDKIHELW